MKAKLTAIVTGSVKNSGWMRMLNACIRMFDRIQERLISYRK